jgi:radical SAM superfamily enzyme YgiQ (UPF0313 family)
MRILLCYTSRGNPDDFHLNLLPVGLGTMNAVLRSHGHASSLANLSGHTPADVESLLHTARPDLIGISLFTHNRLESLRLASLAKRVNPACCVVLGGPHATHRSREILLGHPDVDLVVVGEGEETLLEIVERASRGRLAAAELRDLQGIACRAGDSVVLTPPRPPLSDLDAVPFPSRYGDDTIGVDPRRQFEFIITSRGCPAACTFCASPSFWGRSLRFRSPADIVEEMQLLRERYGLFYFSIRDDTFTADRRRVMEFCRRLVESGLGVMWNCQSRVNAVDEEMLVWMKRAGCECVQFGIESGSVRLLRLLNKRTTPEQMRSASSAVRRAGINLSIYLIAGIPGETEEDLKDTERLIGDLLPHDGQVSPLAYYPGTELFRAGVAAGTVPADLFESCRDEALYAVKGAQAAATTRRLVACLHRVGRRAAYTAADFQAQKSRIGYCHTTSIMAGEMYEAAGQLQRAEQEYAEVVRREPRNPWGWLKQGELYGALGRLDEAYGAFQRLTELVPAHAPAHAALGELALLTGRRGVAVKHYREAVRLDPFDDDARQELTALEKKG